MTNVSVPKWLDPHADRRSAAELAAVSRRAMIASMQQDAGYMPPAERMRKLAELERKVSVEQQSRWQTAAHADAIEGFEAHEMIVRLCKKGAPRLLAERIVGQEIEERTRRYKLRGLVEIVMGVLVMCAFPIAFTYLGHSRLETKLLMLAGVLSVGGFVLLVTGVMHALRGRTHGEGEVADFE